MTKKLQIDELCIEVTRKCNMACEHCLRGDAQNIDITHKTIDNALANVDEIYGITFTGGEPTLNLDAIAYTLDVCKRKQINVDHIYIVTNGKTITDDFIRLIIEWYLYCDDLEEIFGIAVSQDQFHEEIDERNFQKLKALSFFRKDDKTTNFKYGMIKEGRAVNMTAYETRTLNTKPKLYGFPHPDGLHVYESEVYISANGDIKIGCDWAYDNNITRIGNVNTDDLYDCLKSYYTEE